MTDREKIQQLEKINNVREWMMEYSPEEWQTDGIDKDLTFDWLIGHIHQPEEWNPKIDMDTAPRETILDEAVRRMLLRIRKSGWAKWAVAEELAKMEDWK
jgi:hypothetical protein